VSEVSEVGERRGKRRGVGPVVVYTAMRVGLFLGFWWLLQLLTPLRGLWAVVLAIVVSGLVSIFLLNRQRTAMGDVVGGFFGRINQRIDEASRNEDEPEDWLENRPEDQAGGQPEGVGGDQDPGGGQGGNQGGSGGTPGDDANRGDSPSDARQAD
jgi:ABC-type Mn2+/Zn2+ transport systems, permease components